MWSFKKTTVVWGAVLGLISGILSFDVVLAAPNITFEAAETVIPINSSTTLTWTVTDANSCVASGEWSGSKALSGSEGTGALSAGNKVFTLTCTDGLETTVVNADITVADPPTLDYSAVSDEIEYNTATDLVWSSTNATSCEKYGNWSGSAALASTESTGNLISEKTFGIKCTGEGGDIEKSITISISNPALQVELIFFADNNFIDWNEKTDLHWSVSNADFCTASNDWSGAKDKDGGDYETLNLVADTTYTLFCSNSSGSSVTKHVNIFVAPKVVVSVVTNASTPDANIEYNTKAIIDWTSENADYCRVYYGSWTGNLATSGTYTSSNLTANRTFTVRCYGDDYDSDDILISVGANPVLPPNLNFWTDDGSVSYESGTNLNWNTTDTNSLVASNNWSGNKTIPAGNEPTGNLLDDTTYTLKATGDGGSSIQNASVTVGDPLVAPTTTLISDDGSVAYNEATVVRWTSQHADWCKLTYDGTAHTIGATGSEFTGNLIANKTYKLECGNAAGPTIKSITVGVVPIGLPPVVDITADDNPVPYGTGTTVRWTTSNATVCSLSGVGEVVVDGSHATGDLFLPKTYMITCAGPGGSDSDSVTINISGTPMAPPVLNFWADDYDFFESGTTTLYWTAVDADRCWASAGPWNGDKSVPSGDESTGLLTATTSYSISCENINGTVSDSLTITVGPANDVNVEFYADNTIIEKNSSVTLTWNGKNANICQTWSWPAVAGWDQGKYVIADQESSNIVGPFTEHKTTVYLRCWNYTSNSDWIPIVITAGDPPPSITMSAPSPVAYNTPATISWFADYSDSCKAWSVPAEPTWNGLRPTTGLQQTSNLKADTRFYIECENSEGVKSQTDRLVKVGASNLQAPKVTFTSDKYIATEGESYTVSWNVGDATWCSANSNPIGIWSGAKNSIAGSDSFIFMGDKQELFLTCGNAAGSMTSIVTVNKGGVELGLPNISFWADQTAVPVNGKTMLRWTTTNADACSAVSTPVTTWSGTRTAGSGQEQTQALAATTNFELTCTNVAGSRTTSLNIVVGGSPPGVTINFNASKYDVSAGNSTILSWAAENAAYCYALDSNGDFVGGKNMNGSEELWPSVSTIYQLVCGNDGGEVTAAVPVTVAKVIVCPDPARIINIGNAIQLRAYFKQNADATFSCSDTSGAIDVTNGYDGFPTDWDSANSAVVSVGATGLATGLDFTELHGGPITVIAEYKEAEGQRGVIVSPSPITCWKCSDSKTCFSEITFPISGSCPSDTYNSMHECAKSCRKPVDWQEVSS